MRYFNEIDFRKDDISIFCSGRSTFDLTLKDIIFLKKRTYTIALNLMYNFIQTDMVFWSDRGITDKINNEKRPSSILVSGKHSFIPKIPYHFESDFFFDLEVENDRYDGNWTLWYLLQLLHKYYHEKRIFIFGMDCSYGDDKSMTLDENRKIKIKSLDNQRLHLRNFPDILVTAYNNNNNYFEKMYNCSPISTINVIQKINFKDKLGDYDVFQE